MRAESDLRSSMNEFCIFLRNRGIRVVLASVPCMCRMPLCQGTNEQSCIVFRPHGAGAASHRSYLYHLNRLVTRSHGRERTAKPNKNGVTVVESFLHMRCFCKAHLRCAAVLCRGLITSSIQFFAASFTSAENNGLSHVLWQIPKL